jgi:hypothetical protein
MNPLTDAVGREFGVRYGVRQMPQRSLPFAPCGITAFLDDQSIS